MNEIVLTPFESEVLQAIDECLRNAQDKNFWVYAHAVHNAGQRLFGDGWGGKIRTSSTTDVASTNVFTWKAWKGAWKSYPTIDSAFGRLSNKGILDRYDHPIAASTRRAWGGWQLTDAAHTILGHPPESYTAHPEQVVL